MDLLGREGWFRVWIKRGCSRIQRGREEKRREEGSVAVPVCNQLREKNRKRDDRNQSMAVEIDRAKGGWAAGWGKIERRKGQRHLHGGVELEFVLNKQKAKEKPHWFTRHTKTTTRKRKEKWNRGPPAPKLALLIHHPKAQSRWPEVPQKPAA